MQGLADTSAWIFCHRKGTPSSLRHEFDSAVESGDIVTCDVVVLELLHYTRNFSEFSARQQELGLVPHLETPSNILDLAQHILTAIARQEPGRHRSVPLPDLMIAATAQAADVPIIHYDKDYDTITKVTEQPVQWIAEPGSG